MPYKGAASWLSSSFRMRGGGGGKVLLGILGGVVPVFRPGLYAKIMSSLLRLERKQKNFFKSISTSHVSLLIRS